MKRTWTSAADERGEVSSWLIACAGLAAAALLAGTILQSTTQQLASQVGMGAIAAAGAPGAQADAPPAPGTDPHTADGSPAGSDPGANALGTDQDTPEIVFVDGEPTIRHEEDGTTVSFTVDENGVYHILIISPDGTTERYVARIDDSGELIPGGRDGGEALEVRAEGDVIESLQTWHWDDRDALNVDLPPNREAMLAEIAAGSEWFKADDDQADYHQDGTNGVNHKYVHPDGREVVYNLATGEMVTHPAYAGTYNYVHMPNKPDEWYHVLDWLEWAVRGVGHAIVDIIPWQIGGSYEGDGGGPAEQQLAEEEQQRKNEESEPDDGDEDWDDWEDDFDWEPTNGPDDDDDEVDDDWDDWEDDFDWEPSNDNFDDPSDFEDEDDEPAEDNSDDGGEDDDWDDHDWGDEDDWDDWDW